MRVPVTFYGHFKESVDESTVECEISEGSTVGDLVETLTADNEDLHDDLFADGELRPTTRITVNKTHITQREGIDTELESGDEVRIFPPVTGG